ncbi:Gfo/Idh/MocA family oxidoreductase [Desulfobacca acetoxidans]|uniref:Oxidoreductase domain protein n=1 Tax=Desulfobacca acetoxidans (strain ATCC 700848 / DSM 11109 / ASRB2) TaxID=880072 RepID=F2NED9_DESAR|nr:Gfo/Idh/MocA family oxidoreductase [Desulfobacca acetoxidans]AEB08129.1 oxidoreductase domain protein [Desulfobacca acetoxidans DSM 11109]
MTTQEKCIGLIGLGYWGKNILRNLYDLGALHTACDSDPETIAQRRKQFSQVEYTQSFGDLLQNPEIRAIAIAAPAAKHFELTKLALNAGKDVFVEKPLALTVKEGEELVHLAQKNQRILMVGHILQYHPAVSRLKELIAAGELGKLQYIYSNRLSIGKLRTEENILWSFAPHDISVILMLLEEEPVRVSAFGGAYVSQGIYDTTLTTMDFNNGVKGHIFVNWLHPFKEQKLVVVGSKAMAVFDDVSEEKLKLYHHKIQWKEGKIPVAEKAEHEPVSLEKAEPLKAEMQHFIECVLTRKKPKTDGAEGLRVLKILEIAEKDLTLIKPAAVEPARSYFVHESSFIDDGVQIGKGTKIWHFSHVLKDSRIGENCTIGQNVVIGPQVSLGARCKIQNNVSLYKGVHLEEEVFCGPSCVFTNVYNPRAFIERKSEFLDTLVKKGATIGANATVVCGTTLGKYCLVGAGAVVKTDVPDYAIVVGVPARQIGWACKCGKTLKFEGDTAKCPECANAYRRSGEGLTALKEN